jgi:hypothetical protein
LCPRVFFDPVEQTFNGARPLLWQNEINPYEKRIHPLIFRFYEWGSLQWQLWQVWEAIGIFHGSLNLSDNQA